MAPGAGEKLDQRYSTDAMFRHAIRTTTGVYGAGFAATGVVCGILVYTLPIRVAAIAVNGALEPFAALIIVAWSIRYLRHRLNRPSEARPV